MTRILVIEDDKQMQSILCRWLDREGYRVETADDGDEGMRMIRADPPDLVITDIFMPQKEGIQVIMELRRDFPDMKVISISGGGRFGIDDNLGAAKALGASRTFAKPFDWTEFMQSVRELVAA